MRRGLPSATAPGQELIDYCVDRRASAVLIGFSQLRASTLDRPRLSCRMSIFLDGSDDREYRFVGNLERIAEKQESCISYVKYILKKLRDRDLKTITAVGGALMAMYGVIRLFI